MSQSEVARKLEKAIKTGDKLVQDIQKGVADLVQITRDLKEMRKGK